MSEKTRNEMRTVFRLTLLGAAMLLLNASVVPADDHAEARFRGTGKADPIRIENARLTDSPRAGQSSLQFDLAWDHSWRAEWDVIENRHGGTGTLELENWDVAWVFVKFRKPGDDGFSHATLSTNEADHRAPGGAVLDVGLSDDGKRGLGVFIYRNAPGHGPNSWRNVRLRWLHPPSLGSSTTTGAADGVPELGKVFVKSALSGTRDETKADLDVKRLSGAGGDTSDLIPNRTGPAPKDAVEVRVFALHMVYVPQCAFWLGDGSTDHVNGQFSAGDTVEPFRMRSEDTLTIGGTSRENLGNRDGLGIRRPEDFSSAVTQTLSARFPKGFGAFYCMKHELTQGQYVAFLNTLPARRQDEFSLAGIPLKRCGISRNAAKFETDKPFLPCAHIGWTDAAAYAAWAGLRPMTELEFEKASRGPLKPAPNEFAWGTTGVVGGINKPTARYQPVDRYVLKNAGRTDETVVWRGKCGPDATHGNAIWDGSARPIGGPVRAGIFATPNSGRVAAGASYWGIAELSGSLAESVVTIGCDAGRRFSGTHGDGTLSRPDDWRFWGEGVGFGTRGGPTFGKSNPARIGYPLALRTSHRKDVRFAYLNRHPLRGHQHYKGFRGVRTATAGRVPVAPPPDGSLNAQRLFNSKLRIKNVELLPRNAKTRTVRFDIAWGESWRNATNHDAVWVFFKMRGEGESKWRHAKLVADPPSPPTGGGEGGAASKVLNPAGYGQQGGTPVDLIVPGGDDGLTGVFVRRASAGAGAMDARGVTAVLDIAKDTKVSVQAFGVEMAYVAKGPFYLGSGGTERDRFYRYTDGSQNTLPYRVTDAGPIPTGPQAGRLWAVGAVPDGSDAGEIPTAFPNGYRAFYCMKDSVSQGQLHGFLSMHPETETRPSFRRTGRYPVREAGWEASMAFAAWAGLRPMTELEFEKACRGPLEPAPNEARSLYWGIRELNVGGLFEATVSVAHAAGRRFAGTHGQGSTVLPEDWLPDSMMNRGGGAGVVMPFRNGAHIRTSGRFIHVGADKQWDGFRCVRTAPEPERSTVRGTALKAKQSLFALEMNPLPDLRGPDVFLFYLSGRFHNGGDKALNVELTSTLPEACFPGSRTFTAAPKARTAFRILTVLTLKSGRAARTGQWLPVRIGILGGDVLAERKILLPLADPLAVTPPVVGTVDGGSVTLHLTNATDRSHVVTLEMPAPSGVSIPEAKRRAEIAPGAGIRASFPIRSHIFDHDRFLNIPYRVSVESGAQQEGDSVAELHVQSRWWIGRRKLEPSMDMVGGRSSKPGPRLDTLDIVLKETGLLGDGAWVPPSDIFKATKPPKGWETVTHGAGLWLGHLKPRPYNGTILQAATRVTAPAEREAVIKVGRENASYVWLDDELLQDRRRGVTQKREPAEYLRKNKPGHFIGRILFNGEVVYDSRPGAKEHRNTVRIRKGVNTMLVQCLVHDEKPQDPGDLFFLFYDAGNGTRLSELVLDIAKRSRRVP
ncbi:MAG: hypothetical protein AMK72_05075 [Planctomycetes bacterium SM23_25]|nr:MAG: hypothetical protein AMK72_05075 [Planctomycetes bacterium SM23_25]